MRSNVYGVWRISALLPENVSRPTIECSGCATTTEIEKDYAITEIRMMRKKAGCLPEPKSLVKC